MRAFAAALAVATAVLATPPPAVEHGRRLYQHGVLASGGILEVELSTGGKVRGKAAACANCHRPSGFGGVEGGIYLPPVTGPYLFGGRENRRIDLFHELFQEELASEVWARLRHRPGRPAYNAETLLRALEAGHDPTGRDLDPLMPRYSLGLDDRANLEAYLRQLGAGADPGVTAQTIRFTTVIEGVADTPEEGARLAVLKAFFRLKNADTHRLGQRSPDPLGHEEHFALAYRQWELEVVSLDLSAASWQQDLASSFREHPSFALLAGPGDSAGGKLAAFCEEQGIPCLLLDAAGGPRPRGELVRRVDATPCPASSPDPPQAFRARQWLRARGIPSGPGEATALATHHLLTITEAAVMHLLDDFSRAYFLESFDREASRVPHPLGCESSPTR